MGFGFDQLAAFVSVEFAALSPVVLALSVLLFRCRSTNLRLRETQRALEQSEQRWIKALDASGQGVWERTVATREIRQSAMWKRMRGLPEDGQELADRDTWLMRVHPDDLSWLRATIARQDAGEIPFETLDYRERHAAGHYVWIRRRATPVAFDERGKPAVILGIDRDITQKKELEMKAAESLGLLNTMLDHFPGGICMFDRNLKLVVANKGFYELNQATPEELPSGCTLEDILLFHVRHGRLGHGDPDELVMDRLQEALDQSAATYREYYPHTDKTYEYVRVPLSGGGYVATMMDVTQRIADERARADLERELSHNQKMDSLGTLASGVAHEINTPIQYVGDNVRFLQEAFGDLSDLLAAYRAASEAALSAADSAALKEKEAACDLDFLLSEVPGSLEQSLEGLGQVARIVKAIKEFSHPQQDEMCAIDLNAAIRTTIAVSRNQWKYVAEIETNLDPDLPPVRCFQGDINQVVLNMIVNAAQAIEECVEAQRGVISILTRREGDWAVVEIADNGIGMPEEVRKRIFDPFFTTKDIGKGTGQGLAISHTIIHQKHGGSIACESAPGEGTRFIIRFPVDGAEACAERVA